MHAVGVLELDADIDVLSLLGQRYSMGAPHCRPSCMTLLHQHDKYMPTLHIMYGCDRRNVRTLNCDKLVHAATSRLQIMQ